MNEDRVRLFVGADCNNSDLESQAVLEWSIRKYATLPVDITWMQVAAKGPYSGWQTASMRTPFTHFRWSIPDVCGYQGRGIYCDSDFIFRADIAELWRQPIPAPAVILSRGGKFKTCCLLFDCAACRGVIPPIDKLRQRRDAQGETVGYLKAHPERLAPFDGDWNAIDLKGYESIDDPRIKAIHYSRIETQLHLKHAIPRLQREGKSHWYTGAVGPHWRPELVDLFDALLLEARANGYDEERYRIDPHGAFAKRNFTYSSSRIQG